MFASFLGSFLTGPADVVVGTSPQFFTACAAWAVSVCKLAPFIFELRDLWPESIRAVGAMKDGVVLRALERVELFLYRRAAAVVSVTNSFKANLIRRGIAPGKIHVITNGVELDRFQPRERDAELVRELGLEGKFVAGYIGTHGLAHGLDTLLDAAEHVKSAPGGEQVTFLFLGDGADKVRLKARAAERGLSNARFVDSVSKEEVARYWSLLDASIIHLRGEPVFQSVIPSKLFECMGMGVPILLGVEGEAAELLESAGAGEAFKPEDSTALASAVLRVKNEPAAAEQWRRQGPVAARRYDRAALAQKMRMVLEAVSS
jgi:glycosyltransferase involved in cell wall biosynthesis